MRTLIFSSVLLLSGFAAFGQNSSELVDKAPPEIDGALRARVDKFYGAFMAGKFKDAYSLVADDSQDKFFELGKDQYKGCEVVKTRYSDNFTKAVVMTNCKSEWRWQGVITPVTLPLMSNWEIVDGQWYWHYVKPTTVASPFAPNGFVPVPSDGKPGDAAVVPKDIAGKAQAILSSVSVDKRVVHLHSYETSQDVVHVRNDMPGSIGLKLDRLDMPGLKITLGKTLLGQHEETTILFEWRLDDPEILCVDCAKRMKTNPTVQLHIVPTTQTFPINIILENASSSPQASQPVQK
jgi:hypothetical protein